MAGRGDPSRKKASKVGVHVQSRSCPVSTRWGAHEAGRERALGEAGKGRGLGEGAGTRGGVAEGSGVRAVRLLGEPLLSLLALLLRRRLGAGAERSSGAPDPRGRRCERLLRSRGSGRVGTRPRGSGAGRVSRFAANAGRQARETIGRKSLRSRVSGVGSSGEGGRARRKVRSYRIPAPPVGPCLSHITLPSPAVSCAQAFHVPTSVPGADSGPLLGP